MAVGAHHPRVSPLPQSESPRDLRPGSAAPSQPRKLGACPGRESRDPSIPPEQGETGVHEARLSSAKIQIDYNDLTALAVTKPRVMVARRWPAAMVPLSLAGQRDAALSPLLHRDRTGDNGGRGRCRTFHRGPPPDNAEAEILFGLARRQQRLQGCCTGGSGKTAQAQQREGPRPAVSRRTCLLHAGGTMLAPGRRLLLLLLSCGGALLGAGLDGASSTSPGPWRLEDSPQIDPDKGWCSTWGAGHFSTFDHHAYDFWGTCNHVFAATCKDGAPTFSVQLRRGPDGNISRVIVELGTSVVTMSGTTVSVKDVGAVSLPYTSHGLQVTPFGRSVRLVVKQLELELEVLWGPGAHLMVLVERKHGGRLCGLCGDFDGNATNEFLSEEEGKLLEPHEFAALQKLDDPNEICAYEAVARPPIPQAEHARTCSRLLALVSPECTVPREPFVRSCQADMATAARPGQNSSCATLSEYSRRCSMAGQPVSNWRGPGLCSLGPCPATQVYRECGAACARTCSNPQHRCSGFCAFGCFCPKGTVLNDLSQNHTCVPVAQCPCVLNGALYAPGEVSATPCRTCRCTSGRWTCVEQPCPGHCSLEGGSFVTTFDARPYRFHGTCTYILLQSPQLPDGGTLLAVYDKSGHSHSETSLAAVIYLSGQDKIVISQDELITNHGDAKWLPYKTGNITVFRQTSTHLQVATTFGLELVVQLQPIFQVYVTVGPQFRGQTRGLCGNFNGDTTDDFTSSVGIAEGTASLFVDSWRAGNCPAALERETDPCSMSQLNKVCAETHCSVLLKKGTVFERCHALVNPTPFYKRCVYQACNYEDTFPHICATLGSYAHACSSRGVLLQGWRSSVDNCTVPCSGNRTFSYDSRACGRTCLSLSDHAAECHASAVPVDGCNCPEGTYLDHRGECVRKAQCPCLESGKLVLAEQSTVVNGAVCHCVNGRLSCPARAQLFSVACPAPKTFKSCNQSSENEFGAACAPTCQMLATGIACVPTKCEPGCVCAKGLYEDADGQCVPPEECPCEFAGVSYPGGTELHADCRTCTCSRGKWTCQDSPHCPSTCALYGEGHVVTFDGQRFVFDGNCEYILATDGCGANASQPTFKILTENVVCGRSGVTCSRAVKILLGGLSIVLADGNYTVTGDDPLVHLRVQPSALHLVLDIGVPGRYNLTLVWNKHMTVFIKILRASQDALCGLCGNYNGNMKDDFETRSQYVASSELEFVNSWKESPLCGDVSFQVEPCSLNAFRRSWAERKCSLINSQTFAACHSKVYHMPYYEACVRDTCACDTGGDCECLCDAVAAYAKACLDKGVCVDWRTPTFCPIYCEYYNTHRQLGGSSEYQYTQKANCTWHYQPCLCPGRLDGIPGTNVEGCYNCSHDEYFNHEDGACVPCALPATPQPPSTGSPRHNHDLDTTEHGDNTNPNHDYPPDDATSQPGDQPPCNTDDHFTDTNLEILHAMDTHRHTNSSSSTITPSITTITPRITTITSRLTTMTPGITTITPRLTTLPTGEAGVHTTTGTNNGPHTPHTTLPLSTATVSFTPHSTGPPMGNSFKTTNFHPTPPNPETTLPTHTPPLSTSSVTPTSHQGSTTAHSHTPTSTSTPGSTATTPPTTSLKATGPTHTPTPFTGTSQAPASISTARTSTSQHSQPLSPTHHQATSSLATTITPRLTTITPKLTTIPTGVPEVHTTTGTNTGPQTPRTTHSPPTAPVSSTPHSTGPPTGTSFKTTSSHPTPPNPQTTLPTHTLPLSTSSVTPTSHPGSTTAHSHTPTSTSTPGSTATTPPTTSLKATGPTHTPTPFTGTSQAPASFSTARTTTSQHSQPFSPTHHQDTLSSATTITPRFTTITPKLTTLPTGEPGVHTTTGSNTGPQTPRTTHSPPTAPVSSTSHSTGPPSDTSFKTTSSHPTPPNPQTTLPSHTPPLSTSSVTPTSHQGSPTAHSHTPTSTSTPGSSATTPPTTSLKATGPIHTPTPFTGTSQAPASISTARTSTSQHSQPFSPTHHQVTSSSATTITPRLTTITPKLTTLPTREPGDHTTMGTNTGPQTLRTTHSSPTTTVSSTPHSTGPPSGTSFRTTSSHPTPPNPQTTLPSHTPPLSTSSVTPTLNGHHASNYVSGGHGAHSHAHTIYRDLPSPRLLQHSQNLYFPTLTTFLANSPPGHLIFGYHHHPQIHHDHPETDHTPNWGTWGPYNDRKQHRFTNAPNHTLTTHRPTTTITPRLTTLPTGEHGVHTTTGTNNGPHTPHTTLPLSTATVSSTPHSTGPPTGTSFRTTSSHPTPPNPQTTLPTHTPPLSTSSVTPTSHQGSTTAHSHTPTSTSTPGSTATTPPTTSLKATGPTHTPKPFTGTSEVPASFSTARTSTSQDSQPFSPTHHQATSSSATTITPRFTTITPKLTTLPTGVPGVHTTTGTNTGPQTARTTHSPPTAPVSSTPHSTGPPTGTSFRTTSSHPTPPNPQTTLPTHTPPLSTSSVTPTSHQSSTTAHSHTPTSTSTPGSTATTLPTTSLKATGPTHTPTPFTGTSQAPASFSTARTSTSQHSQPFSPTHHQATSSSATTITPRFTTITPKLTTLPTRVPGVHTTMGTNTGPQTPRTTHSPPTAPVSSTPHSTGPPINTSFKTTSSIHTPPNPQTTLPTHTPRLIIGYQTSNNISGGPGAHQHAHTIHRDLPSPGLLQHSQNLYFPTLTTPQNSSWHPPFSPSPSPGAPLPSVATTAVSPANPSHSSPLSPRTSAPTLVPTSGSTLSSVSPQASSPHLATWTSSMSAGTSSSAMSAPVNTLTLSSSSHAPLSTVSLTTSKSTSTSRLPSSHSASTAARSSPLPASTLTFTPSAPSFMPTLPVSPTESHRPASNITGFPSTPGTTAHTFTSSTPSSQATTLRFTSLSTEVPTTGSLSSTLGLTVTPSPPATSFTTRHPSPTQLPTSTLTTGSFPPQGSTSAPASSSPGVTPPPSTSGKCHLCRPSRGLGAWPPPGLGSACLTCSVWEHQEEITYKGCTANVTMTRCEGVCASSASFNIDTQQVDVQCSCCHPLGSYERQLELPCLDPSAPGRQLVLTLQVFSSCGCGPQRCRD
nr:mucin-6 [Microcebus murinus]